jgi:hypothetical protein
MIARISNMVPEGPGIHDRDRADYLLDNMSPEQADWIEKEGGERR